MKRIILFLILTLMAMLYSGSSPSSKTEAEQKKGQTATQSLKEEIANLMDKANKKADSGHFVEALALVRKVVDIYSPITEQVKFRYSVLDFQHFLLLKTGLYAEALENGLILEALGQKLNERKSPWDCLKIADAYLGLKDYDKALDWIEKAVNERSFTGLTVFKNENYAPLQKNLRFQTLVNKIETSLGISQPAKDFTVTLLGGTPFTLSEQIGKVVLIDFWDVICPPCRKALPHLKELHQQFAAKGLVILGISLDTDKKLLETYLKEINVTWPMVCSLKGWADETAKLYRISATPSTWLVDRQGILRHINLKGDELEKAIDKLL